MARAGATNGYDNRYETNTSRTAATEEMIDSQPVQPSPVRPRRRPLAGVSPRDELVEIVRWISTDTLPRTDEELLVETMEDLCFQRRGSKIVTRIRAAVDEFRATDPAK